MTPSVGRIVHYVSYGTPDGEYPSECRAAVVTTVVCVVDDDDNDDYPTSWDLALAILNPTGMFFNCSVQQDETDKRGGTWHWPERVQ